MLSKMIPVGRYWCAERGVGGAIQLTLPPQPARAAGWQPTLWIRASFEPQINADKRRYCSQNLIIFKFPPYNYN